MRTLEMALESSRTGCTITATGAMSRKLSAKKNFLGYCVLALNRGSTAEVAEDCLNERGLGFSRAPLR